MTRNNFITIDLRTLTNQEFYDLWSKFRLPNSQNSHEGMTKELHDRGFQSFGLMDSHSNANYYGKYPTPEEYLATFPQPQDNRTDGGC